MWRYSSFLTRFIVSVSLFAGIITLSPAYGAERAETYKDKGNALYLKKQYAQAITEFTKAIQINPDFLEAYYNRGLAHYDMHLYYKAIVDFDMVLMLKPNEKEAYFNRGLAYSKVNKLKLALSDIQKAADLGDGDAKKIIASGEITDRIEKESRRQVTMNALLDEKQKEYNREVAVTTIDNTFGGNTVSTTHAKGDPLFDGKEGIFKSVDHFSASDVLIKTEIYHTGAFTSLNGRNKTVLWYNPDSTLLKKEFYYTGKMLTYRGVHYYDKNGQPTKKILLNKFGKEVKQ